ncbi:MAG: hypothetical protein AAFV80_04710 [Bacteroidota bacterium]
MIKDKFQMELQSALAELQSNLQDLESAHRQIESAKSAATSVISGIDELRSKYGMHLDQIREKVDSFISQSDDRFRQNVDDGIQELKQASKEVIQIHQQSKLDTQNQMEQVVKEAKAFKTEYDAGLKKMMDRFLKFLDTSSKRFHSDSENGSRMIKHTAQELMQINQQQGAKQQAFIENALSNIRELRNRYADHLNILGEQTNLFLSEAEKKLSVTLEEGKHYIKEVSDQIRVDQIKQQSDNQNLLTELKIHHEAKLMDVSGKVEDQIMHLVSQTNKSIDKAHGQMQGHLVQINDVYANQNEQLSLYLKRFVDLTQQFSALESRIAGIDFPAYFDRLNQQVQHQQTEVANLSQQMKDLDASWGTRATEQDGKMQQQLDNQKKLITLLTWMLALSGATVLALILLLLS